MSWHDASYICFWLIYIFSATEAPLQVWILDTKLHTPAKRREIMYHEIAQGGQLHQLHDLGHEGLQNFLAGVRNAQGSAEFQRLLHGGVGVVHVRLLHIARHAREGLLHLRVAVDAHIPLDDSACSCTFSQLPDSACEYQASCLLAELNVKSYAFASVQTPLACQLMQESCCSCSGMMSCTVFELLSAHTRAAGWLGYDNLKIRLCSTRACAWEAAHTCLAASQHVHQRRLACKVHQAGSLLRQQA